MRPEVLYALFAEVTRLKGIGPRLGKLIEGLAGPHVVDLLWHLPSGVIDRRFSPELASAPAGVVCTLTVHVDAHYPPRSSRQPYKVACSDESGGFEIVFFNAKRDWIMQQLPPGEWRLVSGKLDRFDDRLQMAHPDVIAPLEEADRVLTVEPIYPMTQGLVPKVLRRAVDGALTAVPELPEWADGPLVAQRGWPSWNKAIQAVHAPTDAGDLEPTTIVRTRLAYDELLANQLALALVRLNMKKKRGQAIEPKPEDMTRAENALPFSLTGSQRLAVAEILADMADPHRMLRLLQGDVGSGKTAVAFLAVAAAASTGRQSAMMAPTEILARQHLETLEPLCEAIGLKVGILTGRDKGKARAAILEALEDGEIDLIVGTHALFQGEVAFRDLGLAVIDEQHRFGVHQRMTLSDKGRGVDVLVMTATPIPRTLVMTAYGDLDVSRLTEKPAGRKPIDTRTVPTSRLDDVVDGIGRALEAGTKAYWVCPLVEESEVLEVAAAEERYRHLHDRFGERVGLIHGKMKAADKDRVMETFVQGDVDLLVATTVIEVGVNVPAATIMVIEHAERFGLAQLHQLRGRIGRGAEASTCILLYTNPVGEVARSRLKVMRDSEDGFLIAGEDLRLRGAGEVLGTRQSGLPKFRLADPEVHGDLIEVARDDARLVVDKDPQLSSPRGAALRTLLYLFERDAAVRLLGGG